MKWSEVKKFIIYALLTAIAIKIILATLVPLVPYLIGIGALYIIIKVALYRTTKL